MTTNYQFPPVASMRAAFPVKIIRDGQAWLVVARSHGWLHGSQREALADARAIAAGFGALVMVAS